MWEEQAEKEKYFNFDAKIGHLDVSLDVENRLNWESNWLIHDALSTFPAYLLLEGCHYFSDCVISNMLGESDILVKVKPDISDRLRGSVKVLQPPRETQPLNDMFHSMTW